jgi:hypothetical protein
LIDEAVLSFQGEAPMMPAPTMMRGEAAQGYPAGHLAGD